MFLMILSIFGSISAIFLVVFVHELGHFIAARLLGVKILRFSVGFGPTMWSHTSKKTGIVYALSVIPLGGYLKMYGEQDPSVLEPLRTDLAYSYKPVWVRMMISFAGPLANILFAVAMFSIVAACGITYVKPVVGSVMPHSIAEQAGIKEGDELIQIGSQKIYGWEQAIIAFLPHVGDQKPLCITTKQGSVITKHEMELSAWHINASQSDVIHALGFVPYAPSVLPVIAQVIVHSPAALAGIRANDLILKMNDASVHDWEQVLNMIRVLPNKEVMILVRRGTEEKLLAVHLGADHVGRERVGRLGVMVKLPVLPDSMIQIIHYSVLGSIKRGGMHTGLLFYLNAYILKKMIMGHVSLNTLSGPISIFRTAAQASQAGISVYLSFIGFISVAVGFVNLLPIPVLDGGNLVFQLLELIMRRPLPIQYQLLGIKLGLFFLFCLMLQATVNDVIHLL